MTPNDVSHAHGIAVKEVEKHWGRNAKRYLGETLYEAVLAREVVLLLLNQMMEKYEPAQELVRVGMGW